MRVLLVGPSGPSTSAVAALLSSQPACASWTIEQHTHVPADAAGSVVVFVYDADPSCGAALAAATPHMPRGIVVVVSTSIAPPATSLSVVTIDLDAGSGVQRLVAAVAASDVGAGGGAGAAGGAGGAARAAAEAVALDAGRRHGRRSASASHPPTASRKKRAQHGPPAMRAQPAAPPAAPGAAFPPPPAPMQPSAPASVSTVPASSDAADMFMARDDFPMPAAAAAIDDLLPAGEQAGEEAEEDADSAGSGFFASDDDDDDVGTLDAELLVDVNRAPSAAAEAHRRQADLDVTDERHRPSREHAEDADLNVLVARRDVRPPSAGQVVQPSTKPAERKPAAQRTAKKRIDDVLANLEAAMMGIGTVLTNAAPSCGSVGVFRTVLWPLTAVVGIAMVAVLTVVLILPSFFSLLVFRSAYIETKAAPMLHRQRVLLTDTTCRRALRWALLIVRALPFMALQLVWPVVLAAVVLSPSSSATASTVAITVTLGVTVLLQALGTRRAFKSWHAQLQNVRLGGVPSTTAPPRFDASAATDAPDTGGAPVKLDIKFAWSKPGNWLALLLLAVNFATTVSYPLQFDPFVSSDAATVAAAQGDAASSFPGPDVFRAVFVQFASHKAEVLAYGAAGVVAVLVLVIVVIFMRDTRAYARAMARRRGASQARDSGTAFFTSFTGAVVYGHGSPQGMSRVTKVLVAALSDALFLPVSLRLLQALACHYPNTDAAATLRAQPSIACWTGSHVTLAAVALVAWSLYVPLSIMVAPILMEAPASSRVRGVVTAKHDGIKFVKPWGMCRALLQTVMLVVVEFGPRTRTAGLIVPLAVNTLLLVVTVPWFSGSVQRVAAVVRRGAAVDAVSGAMAVTGPEPCALPAVNMFTMATFACAVWSSVVLLVASTDVSFLTRDTVLWVVVAGWLLLLVATAVAYAVFQTKVFQQLVRPGNPLTRSLMAADAATAPPARLPLDVELVTRRSDGAGGADGEAV